MNPISKSNLDPWQSATVQDRTDGSRSGRAGGSFSTPAGLPQRAPTNSSSAGSSSKAGSGRNIVEDIRASSSGRARDTLSTAGGIPIPQRAPRSSSSASGASKASSSGRITNAYEDSKIIRYTAPSTDSRSSASRQSSASLNIPRSELLARATGVVGPLDIDYNLRRRLIQFASNEKGPSNEYGLSRAVLLAYATGEAPPLHLRPGDRGWLKLSETETDGSVIRRLKTEDFIKDLHRTPR